MNKINKDINNVLADWNPIGVDRNVVYEEYVGYVPHIITSLEKGQLLTCLEDILTNKMQTGYNPNDKAQLDDVQMICRKIIKIYTASI